MKQAFDKRIIFSVVVVLAGTVWQSGWLTYQSEQPLQSRQLSAPGPSSAVEVQSQNPYPKRAPALTQNQTQNVDLLKHPQALPANTENLLQALRQFKITHSKVFKTSAEEQELKSFIKNTKNLEDIANLLKSKLALEKMTTGEQNTAVDILLDALKAETASGNSNAAEEIVLSIIRDEQIENTNLELKSRLIMAGVKAELMFHAANIDVQTMQNALPGPVSQNIWVNVQEVQAQNISASTKELRTGSIERQ